MSTLTEKLNKFLDEHRVGTVDWWNEISGEGMIRDAVSGDWYFVHHSAIIGQNRGERNLDKGAKVSFAIYKGSTRGPQVEYVFQHKEQV